MTHVEIGGEFSHRPFATGVHLTPEQHLLGGISRRTVSLTARGSMGMALRVKSHSAGFTSSGVSFGITVNDVVGLGSQEEMLRPNAMLDVAAVANHQPVRDGSMEILPDNTVGSPLVWPDAERGVAIRKPGSSPQPAITRVVDFVPEARRQHAPTLPH